MSPRLECPGCRRNLPDAFRRDDGEMRCPHCSAEFEFFAFPALTAPRAAVRAGPVAEGEATCFFHDTNRADAVCEGCGRFVCTVCSVDFAGKRLCPGCLEAGGKKRHVPENYRVLYGDSAVALALVPLLVWPLTIVGGPAAVGLAVYGWRRPGSLTRPGRAKLVIGGLLGALETGIWGFVFFNLWLR